MKMFAITFAVMLSSGPALAHPDHLSNGQPGFAHLLTDPYHVGLTAGALALAFALRRTIVRRRRASAPRD